MNDAELRQTVAALREEIARVDDAAERERLHALVASIERQLPDAGEAPGESLLDSFKHFVESIEARHPRLTAIVNDVMMKLANIGV